MKILFLSLLLLNLSMASVKVGENAKDFTLFNENKEEVKLSDFKEKLIVLEWVNHGCPFVKKHYESKNMPKLQKKYGDKGVVWLSIISSAEGKQGYVDADEAKKERKKKSSKASHILLDPRGIVGQAYGAKTTPHMFIIGKDFKVKYQGAIDSIASTDIADVAKAENYISLGLDNLLADKEIIMAKTAPYGCSVKY